jgi:sugar phosphate isomerase/epimerase
MGSVVVKDFYWEKSAGGKWQARWCPLGEGMVRGEFFDKLKEDGFAGPLSMHFEYPEGFISESRNNAEEALEYMRKDTKALGEYLK